FLQGEGGIERLVWISAEVKDELKPRLVPILAQRGLTDLFDKIADETNANTIEELIVFLKKAGHPALTMKPLV
ncbi:MAG: CO dehydrogenase/CO-methylating acetyl-CoA synthase complex subunit beta, partial [Methanoregula sp.]|nr:CO dehydrogenase/CO-methylating acetyl-CoA synthase complex subunit beta [Methanoregula sp.]